MPDNWRRRRDTADVAADKAPAAFDDEDDDDDDDDDDDEDEDDADKNAADGDRGDNT
jgi:hypothetical protein